jgi:Fe-S oxidoreductase
LLGLLKQPRRLRALRRLGGWLALPRWQGWLAARLPAASPWRAALLHLPPQPPAAPVHSSAVVGQAKLALFPGCVASIDDAEAQQAAITLLEVPERAAMLRDAALRQAATREPQQLLSSNIGCRLHFEVGIRQQGLAWRSQHPLVLLARQLELDRRPSDPMLFDPTPTESP